MCYQQIAFTLITHQRLTGGQTREDVQAEEGGKNSGRHLKDQLLLRSEDRLKAQSTHSCSPPHPHPWWRVCPDLGAASPPQHLEITRHSGGQRQIRHVSTYSSLNWMRRWWISWSYSMYTKKKKMHILHGGSSGWCRHINIQRTRDIKVRVEARADRP